MAKKSAILGPRTPTRTACLEGPSVVDDGVACTVDSCDEEADMAIHDPDPAVCSDAVLLCNGDNPDADTEGCTNFALVPAGTFTMGSPTDELGHVSEHETQHEVTLTSSFFIQTTEVTQGQWRALMGNTMWFFKECGDDCPMEMVTWFDAVGFANAKSVAEGLEPCYDPEGAVIGDPDGNLYHCEGYRLPTEAEWEYAARGGTQTAFFTGGITKQNCGIDDNLDRIGWYCGNTERTHPVGEKEANSYGLYDVHGNVYEWVHDFFPHRLSEPARNGSGEQRSRLLPRRPWWDVYQLRAELPSCEPHQRRPRLSGQHHRFPSCQVKPLTPRPLEL